MTLRVAIHPDKVLHPNGEQQSFSKRWIELAHENDIEPVSVNAFSQDILSEVASCDAFMWRYSSAAYPRAFAKRLTYAIETGMGLPVFPSYESSWFYENKLGQSYFFDAAGVPSAATSVFWTREQAELFCDHTAYPFVLKLAGGHQSKNVGLVRNRSEGRFYISQLFKRGVTSLGYRPASRPRLLLRRLRAASEIIKGRNPFGPTPDAELQFGYFYAQEFPPGNQFEVSVIIIGQRAFAVRRFVRPGDFRTQGSASGMDWDPSAIKEDAIRLAYQVADSLDAQTFAVDILYRGVQPVVIELTVNYASWVVQQAPGHWVLHGAPSSGMLEWTSGAVRAEDVIFDDFLAEMRGTKCYYSEESPSIQKYTAS